MLSARHRPVILDQPFASFKLPVLPDRKLFFALCAYSLKLRNFPNVGEIPRFNMIEYRNCSFPRDSHMSRIARLPFEAAKLAQAHNSGEYCPRHKNGFDAKVLWQQSNETPTALQTVSWYFKTCRCGEYDRILKRSSWNLYIERMWSPSHNAAPSCQLCSKCLSRSPLLKIHSLGFRKHFRCTRYYFNHEEFPQLAHGVDCIPLLVDFDFQSLGCYGQMFSFWRRKCFLASSARWRGAITLYLASWLSNQ